MIWLIVAGCLWGISTLGLTAQASFKNAASGLQAAVGGTIRESNGVPSNTDNSDSRFTTAGNVPWTSYAIISFGLLAITLMLVRAKKGNNYEQAQHALLSMLQSRRVLVNQGANPRLVEKRERIYQLLLHELSSRQELAVNCRSVMSNSPTSILPSDSVGDVQRMMAANKIRHLLVRDPVGRLIGIISDRDLKKTGQMANEIMTRKPFTVQASADIEEAINTMLFKNISSVPVMEGDEVVGVISMSDLVLTLQCFITLVHDVFSKPTNA